MKLELQPGEHLIRSGHANHYVRRMLMTGKLHLTNRQVVFMSHPLNFQQYSLAIPLDEIVSVEFKNNLRFFSHGLWIRSRISNEPQHVAVWRRKKWKLAIDQARSLQQ